MSTLPQLMTPDEVAEVLRVSKETVLRWARSGKLPSLPLAGRIIRFRQEDVDQLLAGNRPR